MKTVLIFGVVIECIILILLTVFKKWTKKAFLIVSAVTAVSCGVIGLIGAQTTLLSKEIDQRESLYMASRLIQEEFPEETLEVLSVVSDEKSADYGSRSIRALAYNLNKAHETVGSYLANGENGNFEQIILSASEKNEFVDENDRKEITDATLQLIAASETETLRWEAEMKVRFMGFDLSEEEIAELDSELALVKLAISDHQYEEAFNLLTIDREGEDVKNSIIVSNMYIKNYNQRIMADTDPEYAYLWSEATSLQADLNLAALEVPEGDTTGPEYQAYEKIRAEYNLALEALTQESVKRAINYLTAIDPVDPEYALGYQLQLARLYYMSNQMELAKACIEEVFLADLTDESRWLGREVSGFREAYIDFISNPTNDEYVTLFERMMESLYQSVFDGEDFDSFREFVCSHLRDLFGGLVIKSVSTADFPKVVAEVSATKTDIRVTKQTLTIRDTNEDITGFSVDQTEISGLSLSFVLDRSGSMEGNKLIESKNAIRECISQISDDVPLSFVTFESDSALECALTQSKYLVMNLVEGVSTTGGTNIAAGLSTSIDSLRSAPGTRVIMLLSDGVDSEDSKKVMDSVLAEAIANDITVYTIGLQGCDEEYLQNISRKTGGQFVMVTNTAELNSIYQEIQNSLMNNYTISYTVTNEDISRDLVIHVEDSYTQASKEYSTIEETSEINNYGDEEQQAGYYKQIGGTRR